MPSLLYTNYNSVKFSKHFKKIKLYGWALIQFTKGLNKRLSKKEFSLCLTVFKLEYQFSPAFKFGLRLKLAPLTLLISQAWDYRS